MLVQTQLFVVVKIKTKLSLLQQAADVYTAILRSRAQKFPARHTKAALNGKCCKGYIAPSVMRLMCQFQAATCATILEALVLVERVALSYCNIESRVPRGNQNPQ
jgi:hypothetical protein